jgi:hypothetical protein
MTVRSVYLRSPRLLPDVGACFVLVGTKEGCIRGPREMYGPGPYVNRAWKAGVVLIGFSPAECISIRIATTLGYEYHLLVAVIM